MSLPAELILYILSFSGEYEKYRLLSREYAEEYKWRCVYDRMKDSFLMDRLSWKFNKSVNNWGNENFTLYCFVNAKSAEEIEAVKKWFGKFVREKERRNEYKGKMTYEDRMSVCSRLMRNMDE